MGVIVARAGEEGRAGWSRQRGQGPLAVGRVIVGPQCRPVAERTRVDQSGSMPYDPRHVAAECPPISAHAIGWNLIPSFPKIRNSGWAVPEGVISNHQQPPRETFRSKLCMALSLSLLPLSLSVTQPSAHLYNMATAAQGLSLPLSQPLSSSRCTASRQAAGTMVNPSDSSAAAGPSTPRAFPTPTRGAALPLTFRPRDQIALVVGSNRLAAVRAFSFLEADASVLVTSSEPLESAHEELQYRVAAGEVRYIQSNPPDAGAWQAFLDQHEASLVAVTDTLIGSSRRSTSSAEHIALAARKLRIPINVSDLPDLSSFTFPSVHRFPGESGPSTLQVAVSTNGHGCRLAGRIRRDIATRLPSSVGAAVENVGKLRARAMSMSLPEEERRDISEDDVEMPLNTPVPQLGVAGASAGSGPVPSHGDAPVAGTSGDVTEAAEARLRRMRWVHQMSEYYSYDALSRLTPSAMDEALSTYSITSPPPALLPHHEGSAATTSQQGRIYLVGSGPGHPGLLTVAALHILRTATLILSDKLVPAEVLALIPRSTTMHIAKKFPGNAEGAQNEMMELALAGAQKGEVVVRLKQGDPFVYGRGGEEVLYFREHGFESTVIPGVSSALAGPLMMGIPVTQRGVAESLILCTGVGRQGRAVQLPGYIKSRTLLVLMGVARIASILDVLTSATSQGRDGAAYPKQLPIAVVERASSPDQRVVLSTLEHIEEALRSMEERPPGMMVIGWAALALEGKGRVDVLDGADEAQVVQEWLGGEAWKVREGLSDEWKELLGSVEV